MEVLRIFGSWDQEIDLWFTNHEPLIPTLLVEVTFTVFGPKRFLFRLTIRIKLKCPLILCFSCVLVFRQDNFYQTFALELLAFWLIFCIICTSVGFWKKLMKKLSLQQYILLFTKLRKHLLCFIVLESCYHVGTMLCSILMLAISLSSLCFFFGRICWFIVVKMFQWYFSDFRSIYVTIYRYVDM